MAKMSYRWFSEYYTFHMVFKGGKGWQENGNKSNRTEYTLFWKYQIKYGHVTNNELGQGNAFSHNKLGVAKKPKHNNSMVWRISAWFDWQQWHYARPHKLPLVTGGGMRNYELRWATMINHILTHINSYYPTTTSNHLYYTVADATLGEFRDDELYYGILPIDEIIR